VSTSFRARDTGRQKDTDTARTSSAQLAQTAEIGGIFIPETWTAALGISETAYLAATLGILAGVSTLEGMAILIYRRRTVGPVFSATTHNDKIMYVLLAGTLALGLGTTVLGNIIGHPHDYRLTVAPWFRSIFYLHPDTALILRTAGVPTPRTRRMGTVRVLAPQSPRARVLRARWLPHPGPTLSTAAATTTCAAAHPTAAGNPRTGRPTRPIFGAAPRPPLIRRPYEHAHGPTFAYGLRRRSRDNRSIVESIARIG
jgi:hypothetical protein